jgi:hypothetical protein
MFALSGYRNALYDAYARRHGWRRVDREFTLDSSGKGSKGRKVESLWMNYPPRDGGGAVTRGSEPLTPSGPGAGEQAAPAG